MKIDNDNLQARRTLRQTDIFNENVDFINYYNSLRTFEIGDGAILMCATFSFTLIWGKSLYTFLGIMQIFYSLVQ